MLSRVIFMERVRSIPGVRFSCGTGDSACGLKAGRALREAALSGFRLGRALTKPTVGAACGGGCPGPGGLGAAV
jgi:hypothetical protein